MISTKPPRVRENLNRSKPHNVGYAGGKTLRKRMARLDARKRGIETIHNELRERTKAIPLTAYKMPGAMK